MRLSKRFGCVLMILAVVFANAAMSAAFAAAAEKARAPRRPADPTKTAAEQPSEPVDASAPRTLRGAKPYPGTETDERDGETSRRELRAAQPTAPFRPYVDCMGAYDWYGNYRLWYCPNYVGQDIPESPGAVPVPPGATIRFTASYLAWDGDQYYGEKQYGTTGANETITVTGPCGTMYSAGNGWDWPYAWEVYGSLWSAVYWTHTVPANACLGRYTMRITVTDVETGITTTAETYFRVGYPRVSVPEEQTRGCGNETENADPTMVREDPVNTATGALCETEVDAALPGQGNSFAMARTYNSGDTSSGPFGKGWSTPFDSSLAMQPYGGVVLEASDGQRTSYVPNGTSFDGASGARSRLSSTADGYELVTPEGDSIRFDSSGVITSSKDAEGKGLTFEYSGGKVAAVVDHAGRRVTFSYNADGFVDRMDLPDGRYVTYGYTNGHLTTVTDMRGHTTTYGYDAAGRLESILDPLGHYKMRTTYNDAGRVVSQLDARGNESLFSWDPETQTATTTDPRGGKWRDVYQDNVLSSTIDPLGNQTKFFFDDKLNLIQTTDANGVDTSLSYDSQGNLAGRSVQAAGVTESFGYGQHGRLLSATDGRGNTTTYSYTGSQLTSVTDPLGKITSLTYTPSGQTESITDPLGKVTTYGYDGQGNRTSITSPLGNKTSSTYDPSGRLTSSVEARGNVAGANAADYTTTYAYDNADNLIRRTDAKGNVTRFEYDAAGRLVKKIDPLLKETVLEYDDAGNLVTVTDPRGGITRYSYDPTGNLKSEESPAGKTTYEYDLLGRMTSRTTPRGNVTGANPADFTWTYTYDRVGNLLTETDPLGGTTVRTYDALNRVKTLKDPRGHVTTFEYDGVDNMTKITNALNEQTSYVFDAANHLTSVTDPRGKTTTFTYDANGSRLSATSPLGNKTTYTYDADGRLTSMVEPRGNVSRVDPLPYTTRYAYDAADHLVEFTNPLGKKTTYSYDRNGNRSQRTDALNHSTTYAFDELDRLASVTGPDGGTTSYVYDAAGNLETRTDALSHVTTYGYDLAGRLKSIVGPTGQRWDYDYDADGNQVRTVTPAGNAGGNGTITAAYDALGRRTALNFSDNTPSVAYTYDSAGNRKSMTDGAGTESYDYDAAGRLTSVQRGSETFQYAYDAAGNVAKRTYPGGTVVDATYDGDGRLATLAGGGMSATFTYDAAGNLLTTQFPTNGHAETNTYDTAGRLSSIVNAKGSAVISKHVVTRDAVGNPTGIAITRGKTTTSETYQYDAADRVAKVCYAASCTGTPASIAYTYDKVGNRLTQVRTGVASPGTTTYAYDAADRLLSATTGAGVVSYGHDANGNQTSAGGRTFAYDLANRLVSATSAAGTTTYSYDGDGRRVARAGAAGVRRFLWDRNLPLEQIALEKDGTGAVLRRYLNAPDRTVAFATATAPAYLHHDAFGNVSDVASSAGAAQWSYAYEPFGTTRTETKVVTTAPENPLQFEGQYRDGESGLYQMRARMYDPATGRFTGLDPIAPHIKDGYVAQYVYSYNSPGVYQDLTGEWPWSSCFLGHNKDGSCRGHEVTDVASGIGNGAADVVKGAWNTIRHPIRTAQALWDACQQGYAEWEGSLEGTLQCIDNVNPAASVRRDFEAGIEMLRAGCSIEDVVRAFSRGGINAFLLGKALKTAMSKADAARSAAGAVDDGGSRGSTGRTTAQSVAEQQAMAHAQANPAAGFKIPITMTDPRWPAAEGWVKMQQIIDGVNIHYVYNERTGMADDFKFKDN
jgi:RHS repeat-associated protein